MRSSATTGTDFFSANLVLVDQLYVNCCANRLSEVCCAELHALRAFAASGHHSKTRPSGLGALLAQNSAIFKNSSSTAAFTGRRKQTQRVLRFLFFGSSVTAASADNFAVELSPSVELRGITQSHTIFHKLVICTFLAQVNKNGGPEQNGGCITLSSSAQH